MFSCYLSVFCLVSRHGYLDVSTNICTASIFFLTGLVGRCDDVNLV